MIGMDEHPPKRRDREGSTLANQLDKTLSKVRAVTGVALAFGGPVNSEGVLLSRFDGHLVGPLSGVRLEAGLGLGGKVALAQHPLTVGDYVGSAGITHDYDRIIQAEGLRSMVAAPVVVGRKSVAVVYGALRTTEVVGGRVVETVVREVRALEQQLAVEWALSESRSRATDVVLQENVRLRHSLEQLRIQLNNLARVERGEVQRQLYDALVSLEPDEANGEPQTDLHLTRRELDVLSLVSTGASNAAIGAALNLTTSTVKSYMKNIMTKLDASTRLEAVSVARRHGRIL